MDECAKYVGLLCLEPHIEQGYCSRTWESPQTAQSASSSRPMASAIFYAVPPDRDVLWHRMHRVDEMWLYHLGSPVELVFGGIGELPAEERRITLGPDLEAGHMLQCVFPAGTWQKATPTGRDTAIVSCVVVPGFAFDDYEIILASGEHVVNPDIAP